MRAAKKTEVWNDQNKRATSFVEHNPYWSSSLFNEVYLKNDVPRRYSAIWESDSGFEQFHNEFHNFVLEQNIEKNSTWSESDTVANWIVPIMEMLGWHDKCDARQNPYIKELSLTQAEDGRKRVYRLDLAYVDEPKYKQYTTSQKTAEDKLREARNEHTGIQLVLEAKYWDRLEQYRQSVVEDKKRSDIESDDATRSFSPDDQILKYLDLVQRDFGILTDGKTWRLYHRELSRGDVRRFYEFDLGNLANLVRGGVDTKESREEFLAQAKYFYFFFRKSSLIQNDSSPPLVYEVLSYSKKYCSEVEEDLKKRFMFAMGFVCNSLQKSAQKKSKKIELSEVRNIAESHLFNILFVRSCETRKILPLHAPDYLRVSLTEVVETLDSVRYDSDKDPEDYLRFFKAAFGQKFSLDGFDLFDRLTALYKTIYDGTAGFGGPGFQESVFTKEEWKTATQLKIDNRAMISIVFTLNFIKSNMGERKYQQIPYNIFTPRQLGSIYESFLDFQLEEATTDQIFHQNKWQSANLQSNKVRSYGLSDHQKAFKGDLIFVPNNKDRKLTGSFYTPDFVVDYITSEILDPLVENLKTSSILKLKVCDPAMGSGHFLNSAVQFLTKVYRERLSNELNDDVSEPFEESARKVLDSCIYGIDINPRAVKLAKMGLWLATASINKKLERLDDQLVCLDSILSDESEVINSLEIDGFDAVIGNPPYVRQEILKKSKDHLKTEFQLYDSKADLFVYFIERSQKLLKSTGRLGFIVSNKWMRTEYGQKLRSWSKDAGLYHIIDFGDLPVFADAATYPCIVLYQKGKRHKELVYTGVTDLKTDLTLSVQNSQVVVPYQLLDDVSGWRFSTGIESGIQSKLESVSLKFGELIEDRSYRGLLTGLTEAFVVNENEYKEVVRKDSKSKEHFRKFLMGRDIKRYHQPKACRYLVLIEKGWTAKKYGKISESDAWKRLKKDYPGVANHLEPFTDKAKKRADKGDYWWELRACDYYDLFRKPKIVYQVFQVLPKFTLDRDGTCFNNAIWFIDNASLFLLGYLNSSVAWHQFSSSCIQIRGGYQLLYKNIRNILVPDIHALKKKDVAAVERLVEKALKSDDTHSVQSEINQTIYKILNLSSEEALFLDGLTSSTSSMVEEDESEDAA